MIPAKSRLVTADELMQRGEDAGYELIRGELRTVTLTKLGHWSVSG